MELKTAGRQTGKTHHQRKAFEAQLIQKIAEWKNSDHFKFEICFLSQDLGFIDKIYLNDLKNILDQHKVHLTREGSYIFVKGRRTKEDGAEVNPFTKEIISYNKDSWSYY